MQAILKAPPPNSLTELRSFLGLLNFYGKFIVNLSTLVSPLNDLLKKGTCYEWKKAQNDAFVKAKKSLVSPPILIHYDQDKELVVACDASPYGIGAVLSHRMDNGSEKPISFASRSLSPAEKKYSQLDKEGLAAIFAIKKFHRYIFGRPVTIVTDHKPLLGLFNPNKCIPHMASPRVQRWGLMLGAYDYKIIYRSGSSNANADAMSRLPLPHKERELPRPGYIVCLMQHLSKTAITSSR